jgi:outer membrane protein TolC
MLLLLNLILFPATKEEGECRGFTLKEVQNYAVEYNVNSKNARLDVIKARKKIWETTATGLPQISAALSYQDMLQIPTTLIPAQIFDPDAEEGTYIKMKFGTQHNASFNVTATQLVFSGSYIVALQASKIYLRISQESLAKSEIEVKETVTSTYYLILMSEALKETLESSLDNLKKTLYETTELYKAGFVEDTDVDQIQLSVTELKNSIKSMERQIVVAYRLLKFQMGFDLETKIQLKDKLANILDEIKAEELMAESFNLKKHIDYRLVDVQERSQELLLKREKTEYLPTITAYITHQQSAMRDEFNFFKKGNWFPSTIFGIDIAIPIFSSRMRAAKVAQAKLELKKAKNSKKNVIEALQLELAKARSNFSDAYEKSIHTKENVGLAKRIYQKTQIKYGDGLSSSLDLIQVHNQYLSSESNYTRALVDFLNAKIKLDKVLSKL